MYWIIGWIAFCYGVATLCYTTKLLRRLLQFDSFTRPWYVVIGAAPIWVSAWTVVLALLLVGTPIGLFGFWLTCPEPSHSDHHPTKKKKKKPWPTQQSENHRKRLEESGNGFEI